MNETKTEVPARHSRSDALAPYARLREADCVVVGVGAVGRQVAHQLAAMGVRSLAVFDHDAVEDVNLGPQLYRPAQLGANKAEATVVDCSSLNPEPHYVIQRRRFARSDHGKVAGAHVFACVDSITARRLVWEACCKGGARWLGDARVAGETARVIAQAAPRPDDAYGRTLFAQGEAFVGSCTARMTVYMATLAASLLVGRFAQSLRGMDDFLDQQVGLLSWDLTDLTTETDQ